MRTIVDIPENDIKALDSLGKKENLSRAELVRRAVGMYLEAAQGKSAAAVDDYFGFLKDCPEAFDGLDSLEYQRKMRAEWDDRDKMYSSWGLQEDAKLSYKHKTDEEKS